MYELRRNIRLFFRRIVIGALPISIVVLILVIVCSVIYYYLKDESRNKWIPIIKKLFLFVFFPDILFVHTKSSREIEYERRESLIILKRTDINENEIQRTPFYSKKQANLIRISLVCPLSILLFSHERLTVFSFFFILSLAGWILVVIEYTMEGNSEIGGKLGSAWRTLFITIIGYAILYFVWPLIPIFPMFRIAVFTIVFLSVISIMTQMRIFSGIISEVLLNEKKQNLSVIISEIVILITNQILTFMGMLISNFYLFEMKYVFFDDVYYIDKVSIWGTLIDVIMIYFDLDFPELEEVTKSYIIIMLFIVIVSRMMFAFVIGLLIDSYNKHKGSFEDYLEKKWKYILDSIKLNEYVCSVIGEIEFSPKEEVKINLRRVLSHIPTYFSSTPGCRDYAEHIKQNIEDSLISLRTDLENVDFFDNIDMHKEQLRNLKCSLEHVSELQVKVYNEFK